MKKRHKIRVILPALLACLAAVLFTGCRQLEPAEAEENPGTEQHMGYVSGSGRETEDSEPSLSVSEPPFSGSQALVSYPEPGDSTPRMVPSLPRPTAVPPALPSPAATAPTPAAIPTQSPALLPTVPATAQPTEPPVAQPTEPAVSSEPAKVPEPTAVPSPPLPNVTPAPDDAPPSIWLDNYLTRQGVYGHQLGLVYIDLISGERFEHNPDLSFIAASTIKVPMAMYTYDRVHAGYVSLETTVAYQAAGDYEGGAGSLQHTIRDGDRLELGLLLDLAIRESDNIATQMIFRFWREDPECLSLSARMNTAYGLSYGTGSSITAAQMAGVLERLHNNPDRNPYYDHLLENMRNTTFNGFFTARITTGLCAHKYGWYGNGTGDAGIVYGDRPFIFAIYGDSLPRPADVYSGIGEYFHRYALRPTPPPGS